MQLMKTSERNSRIGTGPAQTPAAVSPRVAPPNTEQTQQPKHDTASIREYGAMMSANGHQRSVAASDNS